MTTTLDFLPGSKQYIHFKNETIELTYGEDGLWRSEDGCIFALRRLGGSADSVDRPGIWPFVMPISTPMDSAANVHDYLYECPAYQMFYTRAEADQYLHDTGKKLAGKSRVWNFVNDCWYRLARVFGSSYWENDRTNN